MGFCCRHSCFCLPIFCLPVLRCPARRVPAGTGGGVCGVVRRMGNRFAAKGPAVRMPAVMRKPATTTIPTAAAITGQGFSVRMGLTAATAAAAISKTADAATESPAIIQTTGPAAITGQGKHVRTIHIINLLWNMGNPDGRQAK